MTDALRYEWTRLTTLRSTYWLIALALLISGGIAFLFGYFVDFAALEVRASVLTGGSTLIGAPLAGVMLAIIGIFTTGHEYRHNTIQPTLIAVPKRMQLLTAKVIVATVTALVITLLSVAINAVIGAITLGEQMDLADSALVDIGLGYVALVLLWTLFGLAMAQLFRGVPSALVLLFVIPMVIEPLIIGLSFIPALDWLGNLVPYLPFSAGQALVTVPSVFEEQAAMGGLDVEMLGRWEGGGVMALYVIVLLAIGAALFRRRDA